MPLHRAPLFLRGYRFLPHHLLNSLALRLSRATWPRPLVEAMIRAWVRRGHIDLAEFEPGPFHSIEELFLRRLRPGARPLGHGLVSPVDGTLVESGVIEAGRALRIKGESLSVERIVNGATHDLPLGTYEGGTYVVIFLSPDGYHRIHAPAPGVLDRVQWIPGRFFPQNDDALRHIPRVYERNERATLRLLLDDSDGELLLVLVGASLVGGIELAGVERESWLVDQPISLGRHVDRGDEIAHFRFGSTVVMLLPRGSPGDITLRTGDPVRMGASLFGGDDARR